MSELEKARAGFVLSLLLFSLGLVMLEREEPAQPSAATVESIVLCAATKGALCDRQESSGAESDTKTGSTHEQSLGSMAVVATRLPAHLGEMLVLAPRLSTELDGRLRLATARGPAETEVIVAQ